MDNQPITPQDTGATRRELFERIGKGAAYVAPATLVVLSSTARAAS